MRRNRPKWQHYLGIQSRIFVAGTLSPSSSLPNGHILINFERQPDGANSVLQEVGSGNNVIWQMTAAQLNTALAAATCTECNVTILGTHHDFVILPNGHLVVWPLPRNPRDGTVFGDIIIDLGDMENVGGNNPNHTPQPVWAWNEFNHFDINRRPYLYPDWTHTNAVIYSKDDGNLIISSRHQNWLVKIDYNNGVGAGTSCRKLGAVLPGDTGQNVADFALQNPDGTPDTNATDWFFAQHGPSFVSTNTSGKFSLTLFDNGDDRGAAMLPVAPAASRVSPSAIAPSLSLISTRPPRPRPLCLTPPRRTTPSSAGTPKSSRTATSNTMSATMARSAGFNGTILEVTQSSSPQTVWKMVITGQNLSRHAHGSLYPGVQW